MSERNGLPQGWATARLGDIGDWFGGSTPSKADVSFWIHGTIPWISPKDMKTLTIADSEDYISAKAIEDTNIRQFPEGTVLIVIRSGILARTLPVAVAAVPATMNQDLKGIRPFKGIAPRFIAYQLIAREQEILSSCSKHGTTVASISTNALHELSVRLAPTAEQQRIVREVEELTSDLDSGVSALTRARVNLTRYRASVLKAAVDGSLTEQWRGENKPKETGRELLARILLERQRNWEEQQRATFEKKRQQLPKNWQARYNEPVAANAGGLPDVPEGWCWATLEQLITHSEYGTSLKCDYDAPGEPILRIPNIAAGKIDFRDLKRATRPLGLTVESRLRAGDLLMCRTNGSLALLGKSAVVLDTTVEAHGFASYLLRFRFVLADVLPLWIRVVVSSPTGRRFIERHAASSAGQHNISLRMIHRMPIPLPCLAEQAASLAAIDESLTSIDVMQTDCAHDVRRAARLRQSILKEAFKGKLVAQDPADEPATELLARIQTRRQIDIRTSTIARKPRRVPREITYRRAAIVAYTIEQLGTSESFGRTQLEKTLYLAQTHYELDLRFEFRRFAAGPFDEAIYKLEATARKNGWFATQDRGNYGVTYHPAPKTGELSRAAVNFLGPKKATLDRLLGHIAWMNMTQAEVFATAYAAWNDLLIDGRNTDDETIITEFYAWENRKKQFDRQKILKCLNWMRQEGYVPTGKGERTRPIGRKTRLPSRRSSKRS